MDDAATSMSWIGPLLGGLAAIVVGTPAIIIAWAAFNKGRADTKKVDRNGVIDEWQDAVARVKEELDKTTKRLDSERATCDEKINALDVKIIEMEGELSALKRQNEDRETERIRERVETRKLERTVAELEKPDTDAIAEAVVEKMAESPVIVTNPVRPDPCPEIVDKPDEKK